ncbi:MAG: hypothetical protein RR329_06850, partial [Mucinivorans sp.]
LILVNNLVKFFVWREVTEFFTGSIIQNVFIITYAIILKYKLHLVLIIGKGMYFMLKNYH